MSYTKDSIIEKAHEKGVTPDTYMDGEQELRQQALDAEYFDALDAKRPDEERWDFGEGE